MKNNGINIAIGGNITKGGNVAKGGNVTKDGNVEMSQEAVTLHVYVILCRFWYQRAVTL